MSKILRILWVEDSEADAELMSLQIADSGLAHEYRRVEDEAGLRDALERYAPDVVLSDLSMPGFSGERALEIVREASPRTPFVYLSGTLGEDAAVNALRNGAIDYVLKQSPARLASAVQRAVREAAMAEERERAAAELLRAQRMQGLSMLVNGLSQDLRALLQPLSLIPNLMRTSAADPSVLQWADIIDDCARRGGEMVDSMLSFASGSSRGNDRVYLGRMMEALRGMLQSNLPRGVTLDFDMPEQDMAVIGNAAELQQCLFNLCRNGIQAMEHGGGELAVAATNLAGKACLTVSDTGAGMSEDVRSRLFTPSFSTGAAATGLGLMSCKRVVESVGGSIHVQSAPGEGTRIEVLLPLAPAASAEPVSGPPDVLVVDGDVTRLALTSNVLSAQGLLVASASDGTNALGESRRLGLPAVVIVDAGKSLLPLEGFLAQLAAQGFDGSVLVLYDVGCDIMQERLSVELPLYYLEKPVLMTRLVETVSRLHVPGSVRTPDNLDAGDWMPATS